MKMKQQVYKMSQHFTKMEIEGLNLVCEMLFNKDSDAQMVAGLFILDHMTNRVEVHANILINSAGHLVNCKDGLDMPLLKQITEGILNVANELDKIKHGTE